MSSQVKKTGDSLNKFGQTAKAFSVGFIASMGAAFSALSAVSFGKYLQFDKALGEVSTLLSGTREEMDFLAASAKNMAKSFSGDATQQLNAFYQIISAGVSDVAAASEVLTAANKLAIGGVTDLKIAADGLTTAINAYGGAINAVNVSDTLFVGVKRGKTTIDELSTSLGKVLPLAASSNVSLKETVAVVSSLTTVGISTREAVTGLRAILAAILKPTQSAADYAKKLGLQFDASALKAKGLSGFLQDVKEKTGGSEAALAQLFTGVESLVPALALMGDAGETYISILEDMEDAAGAAEEAYGKMADRLSQQWKEQLNSLNTSFLSIGKNILTVLVPALTLLASTVELVSDNISRLLVIGGTIAGFMVGRWVASFVLARGSVLALAYALNVAQAAFKAFATKTVIGLGLVALGEVIYRVSSANKSLESSIDNVTLAMGDEIRQSNLLKAALDNGSIMSLKATKAKLDEAMARYENIKALVAERKALAEQPVKKFNDNASTVMGRDFDKRGWEAGQSAMQEKREKELAALQAFLEQVEGNISRLKPELARLTLIDEIKKMISGLEEADSPRKAYLETQKKINAAVEAGIISQQTANELTKQAKYTIKSIDLSDRTTPKALRNLTTEITKMISELEEADSPQKAYLETQKKINAAVEAGIISQQKANELMKQTGDVYQDAVNPLIRYSNTVAKEMNGVRSHIVNALQKSEDAFRQFVRTGKFEFKSLVGSVLEDIAVLNFKKRVLGPLAGALGNIFNIDVPTYHNGGVVGSGSVGRQVPVAAFAEAPRFHNGGLVGLRPDEVPAILQTGERVLNRRETKAYGNSQGGVPHVTIHVDARGAVEGVAEQISNQLRASVPDIIKQAVVASVDARRRGLV